MSKGTDVKIITLAENQYGFIDQTGGVSWRPMRRVSDTIGAEPTIEVNNDARPDRMTSGQKVTGVAANGTVDFELSPGSHDHVFESAMRGTWTPIIRAAYTINTTASSLDVVARTLTVDVDPTPNVQLGDRVTLSGFTNANNNFTAGVTEVTATTISFWELPIGAVDETAAVAIDYAPPATAHDRLTVGTTARSFSMEKSFTDINRFLMMPGMTVPELAVAVPFGEKVTGSFTFLGASATASTASLRPGGQFELAAPTGDALSAESDVPYLSIDQEPIEGLCVQSIGLNLNNNLTAQNCVGRKGATGINAGTAAVSGTLNLFLSQGTWKMVEGLLLGNYFDISWQMRDSNGDGYSVTLPRIGLTGRTPDGPAAEDDVFVNVGFNGHVDNTLGTSLEVIRYVN